MLRARHREHRARSPLPALTRGLPPAGRPEPRPGAPPVPGLLRLDRVPPGLPAAQEGDPVGAREQLSRPRPGQPGPQEGGAGRRAHLGRGPEHAVWG